MYFLVRLWVWTVLIGNSLIICCSERKLSILPIVELDHLIAMYARIQKCVGCDVSRLDVRDFIRSLWLDFRIYKIGQVV